jgi:hypothetical protein
MEVYMFSRNGLGLRARLCLVSILPFYVGCTRHLITPPARVPLLESPQILAKGRTSAVVSGGADADVKRLGGAGVGEGMVLLKRGMTEHWEAGVSLNWMHVLEDRTFFEKLSPDIGSIHLQAKFNPNEGKNYLAWLLGTGLGTSGAAQFASFDFGVVGGIPNDYFVPLFGAKVLFNVPWNAREVDLGSPSDTAGQLMDKARFTTGFETVAGFQIPFSRSTKIRYMPTLMAEIQYGFLDDGHGKDASHDFLGFATGLEFPFGK